MDNVEIRPVPGWEGKYSASSDGRIFSENYRRRKGERKEKKYSTNHKGYLLVGMSRNGKLFCYAVHKLIAMAFLPPDPDRPQINHIDGNKRNNAALNLERCTAAENIRHGFKAGLIPALKGELNGNAKLTEDAVSAIRSALNGRPKRGAARALARHYGVTDSLISQIKHKQAWQ